jgi:hypothetical protein
MIPMVDLIYLSRSKRETFRREQFSAWVQGSSAGTFLYVMLSCLERHKLSDIPAEILHELWLRQRSLDRLNLKLAHALIDQYAVDGRTVGFALGRINMRILWRTLLWSLLPARLRLKHTLKK